MTILTALALAAAQAQAPVHVPEAEAVRTMHEFAACVARERTGEARTVLAMDYRTDARQRRLRELARSNNRCLDRNVMSMSELLFAGALAEQLYLTDNRGADAAALVSAARLEARSRSEALGNCVIRQAPAEARAVLDTPATSESEGTALEALRPAIQACLQGADEARMNRPGLRSLIALSLYHAARVTTAAR